MSGTERVLSYTLYPDLYTKTGTVLRGTWDEFACWLESARCETEEKFSCPAWLPAAVSGERRAENVQSVCMFAADVDSARIRIEDAFRVLSGVACVMHTTWSDDGSGMRYRIVVPLMQDCPSGVWRGVWRRMCRWLERRGIPADRQCSDASRAYLVPSHRPGMPFAFLKRGGIAYDCTDAIAAETLQLEKNRSQQKKVLTSPVFCDRIGLSPERLVDQAVSRAVNGRNNAGFWLCAALCQSGCSEHEAALVLQEYVERVARCGGHEYTLAEAMRTLRSVYRGKR